MHCYTAMMWMNLENTQTRGLPWRSTVLDSAQVPSLGWELRSHMLHS